MGYRSDYETKIRGLTETFVERATISSMEDPVKLLTNLKTRTIYKIRKRSWGLGQIERENREWERETLLWGACWDWRSLGANPWTRKSELMFKIFRHSCVLRSKQWMERPPPAWRLLFPLALEKEDLKLWGSTCRSSNTNDKKSSAHLQFFYTFFFFFWHSR